MEDLAIVSLMRINLVDDHPVQGRLNWRARSEKSALQLLQKSWNEGVGAICNPNHDDKVVREHRVAGSQGEGDFGAFLLSLLPLP